MFTTREILYTAAVPAAVALVALALSWRPWRREEPVLRGHWGGALSAGAAFLAAYALLDGEIPAWPPGQARHWLFHLAAGLTILGLLDAAAHALFRVPDWVRAELALAASAGVVLCLFQSLLRSDTWPAPVAAAWVAGMAVVLHIAWVSTEVLVARLPRAAGPAVAAVFTAGVALVCMLSGSLVYGRLAAVLAVVCGVAFAVALAAPGFTLARGAVSVVVPVSVAVVFLGYHLAGLDAPNGSLLLAGLLLPWLARVPLLAGRRPWVRATVAVLLALLPVGAATWRARQAFLKAQQEDSGAGELYTLLDRHVLNGGGDHVQSDESAGLSPGGRGGRGAAGRG